MKLAEWARQEGVHYQTALKWFHNGELPVPAYQIESSGTIVVSPVAKAEGKTVGYARVSSSRQQADLDRQVARLATSGTKIDEFVTEIGSANGRRPRLRSLLADPGVAAIVVEKRDRLAEYAFDDIEAALSGRGASIVVLDA